MVTPALASLTSQLVDVARNGGDPDSIANALTRLHALAFLDLLPSGDRPRIVDIVQARLSDTRCPTIWLAALELAVATGDQQLRSMVAAIGSGALQPASLDAVDVSLFVRSAAQRALNSAREWSMGVSSVDEDAAEVEEAE